MLNKVFCCALIGLFLSMSASASTYYVSKSGNDSRSGSSWSEAWSSLDKVNSSLQGGDTVYFGSGVWYGQIFAPSGASYYDRTLYACSSLVQGIATISGADRVVNWSAYNSSIWQASYTASGDDILYTVAEDDSLMARKTSLSGVVSPGHFYYDASGRQLYIRPYSGQDPNQRVILASNRIVVDLDGRHSYTTFWGLNIRYGNRVVVRIGGTGSHPDSVLLDRCTISHVSGQVQQNTALVAARANGADTSRYGHYNMVRQCHLYACREETGWYGHNKILNFYSTMYAVVESCLVEGGGIGINFKGQTAGSYMRGNVARFNTVIGSATGIDLTSWHVQDSIYGNIIIGARDWGIALEGNMDCWGNFVGNNTIYNCGSIALLTSPWMDEGNSLSGSNWFKYNIIYTLSGNNEAWVMKGTDTLHVTVDSNIYYASPLYFRTSGVSGMSFATWQSRYGFDLNGNTDDPGFDDPDNGDFSRPGASAEMDLFYGGRRWTLFGAVQTAVEDTIPPSPITDLSAFVNDGIEEVDLSWTAPGDDGMVGRASQYDIRHSIDELFETSWNSATQTVSASTPKGAGLREMFRITGLQPDTVYYFAIKTADEAFNQSSISNIASVRLSSIPSGPNISDVNMRNVTAVSAVVEWNTDEPATSQVFYGPNQNYDFSTSKNDTLRTYHQMFLDDLSPGTTYHCQVVSMNAETFVSRGPDITFTTVSIVTDAGGESSNYPGAYVYPNPFRFGETSWTTFSGVPTDKTLTILTVSGQVVKRWVNHQGGEIFWNGENESGNLVSSDKYLWFVEGTNIKGKLVVIR